MPEKKHFWFHREPFKPGFSKEPFPYRVLQRTYKGASKNLKKGYLRHHFWFHKEPFKPGFFKELFPFTVLFPPEIFFPFFWGVVPDPM